MPVSSSPAYLLPVLFLLISGTLSAIANKALYELRTKGYTRECGLSPREFAKPYFLTLTMFIGESLCLLYYYYQEWARTTSSNIYRYICSCWDNYNHEYEQINNENMNNNNQIEEYQYNTDDVSETPINGHSNNSNSKFTSSIGSKFSNGNHTFDTRKTDLPSPPLYFYLFFCLFDLGATAVGGIGLIYISASVNQMMRGSMILFTALFARILLSSPLRFKQYIGIALACVGLSAVGLSSQLRAYDNYGEVSEVRGGLIFTAEEQFLGICLVLIGSALNSLQNVLEEKLLKSSKYASPDPLIVVGWEGVFGSIICLILLPVLHYLPGDDCGSIENLYDTLAQISHSKVNLVLNLTYMLCLGVLNCSAVAIGGILSATHRNICQALKTILVWNVSVLLYYVFTKKRFGESVDNYSLIQVLGFIVLGLGTFLYGLENQIPHAIAVESLSKSNSKSNSKTQSPYVNKGYGSTDNTNNSVSLLLNELHTKPVRHVAFLTSTECLQQNWANDMEYLSAIFLIEYNIILEEIVWTDTISKNYTGNNNESISNYDWRRFSAVIIRSTWDYSESRDICNKFLLVMKYIESQTLLLNPYPVIRDNSNKLYLKQLAQLKIPTIDTIFIEANKIQNNKKYLKSLIMQEKTFENQSSIVIKPSISAGARNTIRINISNIIDDNKTNNSIEQQLSIYDTNDTLLIQPLANEVLISGELSFIFFSFQFSHCVLKQVASNDFRVQEQYGGKHRVIQPSLLLIEQAQNILMNATKQYYTNNNANTNGIDLLYARVDCIVRNSSLYLMELELIEPSLYWEFLNQKQLSIATKLFASSTYKIINKYQLTNKK